jgi:hypothetical protein
MAQGGFDLGVLVGAEQGLEAAVLLVGEQVVAGMQHPPGAEQWVAGTAAVAVEFLLDAAPALVQCFGGEADHVERVHHCDRVGQFLGSCGLEAGEAVHRDHLELITPGLGTCGEPGLEDVFRASLAHVQQLADPVRSRIGVRSMITVTYLSPRRVWRKHMLIHADHLDVVEPVRVRNLTNYVARSPLETGGFRRQLHPRLWRATLGSLPHVGWLQALPRDSRRVTGSASPGHRHLGCPGHNEPGRFLIDHDPYPTEMVQPRLHDWAEYAQQLQ